MRLLVSFIFVVGFLLVVVSYGVDKLMQAEIGTTYFFEDTIDNDLVSLKTGITVLEYDDHVLVKQANSYIRLMVLIKFLDNELFDGLLQGFLSSFLEMDITEDVGIFDIIVLFVVASIIPVLMGLILRGILKWVGKKLLPGNWSFVGSFILFAVSIMMIYQPLIDNLANVRMLLTYNHEASKATMEILHHAVEKKAENEEKANSILSFVLQDRENQSEIGIHLGDELKTVKNSPNHSTPPNLVNIIQSEQYLHADEKEKKKLEEEQIKQNAEELRNLIFWVYAGIDMGEGNSGTEFSAYSKDLVEIYFKQKL